MSEGNGRHDTERRHPACCGVTHTEAVEDALRTIFVRSGRGEPVSTSALAAHLGVTAPTVSTMLRRLTDHGLLERTDDHRALLTPHGRRHAEQIVRRHRLLETFLVTLLDLAWDEVHDEADVLEHAVSDRLIDRIDEMLGHPDPRPARRPDTPAGRTARTRSGAAAWTRSRRAPGSGSSGCTTGTAARCATSPTSACARE